MFFVVVKMGIEIAVGILNRKILKNKDEGKLCGF